MGAAPKEESNSVSHQYTLSPSDQEFVAAIRVQDAEREAWVRANAPIMTPGIVKFLFSPVGSSERHSALVDQLRNVSSVFRELNMYHRGHIRELAAEPVGMSLNTLFKNVVYTCEADINRTGDAFERVVIEFVIEELPPPTAVNV